MKWFKHDTDMHTDLKIQTLIGKHGLEGYALWNLCLEMVGKEGKKGKLGSELRWLEGLLKVVGWSDKGKIEVMLKTMAECKLICPKSFNYGNLYIPKFMKRADTYTRRQLRTDFEQSSHKVPLDKIREDKIREIRTEYVKLKGWLGQTFDSSFYGRTGKAIGKLFVLTDKNSEIIDCLRWASKQKWCDWTLETCIRKWPDFQATKHKQTKTEGWVL